MFFLWSIYLLIIEWNNFPWIQLSRKLLFIFPLIIYIYNNYEFKKEKREKFRKRMDSNSSDGILIRITPNKLNS